MIVSASTFSERISMPRPALSEFQLSETRARILEQAGRIISDAGYIAFSMRKLAGAVGLTAGALYRYFPTRQAVLVAYCSSALDTLARDCKQIADNEPNALRALERMLLTYADFAMDDPGRFRVLFLDPEVTRLELDAPGALDAYDVVLRTVEHARNAGLLRPLPVIDIARILLASVHGVCVLAVTVREIDFSDERSLVVESVRNALRGLSVPMEEV